MLTREPPPPPRRRPTPPDERVDPLAIHTRVVLDALDACVRGEPERAERMVDADPTSSWPPGG